MKKYLLLVLVAAMFIAVGAAKSQAGDQDFVLINNTGVEINNLYVSPASADEWGDDILGDNTVEDGNSVTVKFPREADECNWDFMVKDEEGTGVQWTNIDLCKYGKITLHIEEGKAIATFE